MYIHTYIYICVCVCVTANYCQSLCYEAYTDFISQCINHTERL